MRLLGRRSRLWEKNTKIAHKEIALRLRGLSSSGPGYVNMTGFYGNGNGLWDL
jgi:hypothetical protein